MTSDELISWMDDNNFDVDYEDFDDIDSVIDSWVKKAKDKSDDGRWKSFQSAVKGKLKDNFIEPAADIKKEIEESEIVSELPNISPLNKFFKKPLEKGLNVKKEELKKQWRDTIEVEIQEADEGLDLERIKEDIQNEALDLPKNDINKLNKKITKKLEKIREKNFETISEKIPDISHKTTKKKTIDAWRKGEITQTQKDILLDETKTDSQLTFEILSRDIFKADSREQIEALIGEGVQEGLSNAFLNSLIRAGNVREKELL